MEMEDIVDIDGVVFRKPFVEKPVSAEDHNVHVYFPLDCGGGSQRLFRKVSWSCCGGVGVEEGKGRFKSQVARWSGPLTP